MKTGPATTYINDRLGNLLDEHGPSNDGKRSLADKLNYIVPGWDKILRDEKRRWTDRLAREEWLVCQACTASHSFAMDTGSPLDLDLSDAVLARVEDATDKELGMANAEKWRLSTIKKLHGATVASQLALIWMLIRERNRAA